MINIVTAIVLTVLFAILLISSEIIYRSNKEKYSITRKITHVISILFTIVMYLLLPTILFLILLLAYFVVICISYKFELFSSIHRVNRKTYGEIVLPIGILLAFIISGGQAKIFIASIAILGFSDAAANFAGFLLKSNRKTISGSIAFFLTSIVVIGTVFEGSNVLPAILVAGGATIAERLSTYGLDNISIPLVASILMRLLIR